MTPIPASDPLLLALAAAEARHNLLAPPPGRVQAVIVAVSGGADSVCLLHALLQVADQWGLALHVAHVDHGLRPYSTAESEFVASLARSWGLPLHNARLDPHALRADPAGLEAAARKGRYTFLSQVARQITPEGSATLPCVAVAHHANDQAETVLLRLTQGSGLAGLAGLRPAGLVPLPLRPGERPVRLVRPLLSVQRTGILAYLARHNLPWVEDESNADLDFARNRLRHVVLPALAAINPGITATLCRNAEMWAEQAERLAMLDAAALAQLVLEPPAAERIVLDLDAWRALAGADRRGVLRAALAHLHADARQLGFAHLEAIVQRTDLTPGDNTRSSGPHPLPGGLAWSVVGARGGQGARICLHVAAVTPLAWPQPQLDPSWRQAHTVLRLPVPGVLVAGEWRLTASVLPVENLPPDWRTTCGPWSLYAAAAALQSAALTTHRPGMRIAPLGMGGHHRRVVDVLRSHKTPPSLREGWPLLVDCRDGQVLWVCGLQLAEPLRITPHTQAVVLLQWLSKDEQD